MAKRLKMDYMQIPKKVGGMSIRWPEEASTYVKWPKETKLKKKWKRALTSQLNLNSLPY